MDTLLQGMIRYDQVDSHAAPGRPTSREEIDREFAAGRRKFSAARSNPSLCGQAQQVLVALSPKRLTVCGYGSPGSMRYDAAHASTSAVRR